MVIGVFSVFNLIKVKNDTVDTGWKPSKKLDFKGETCDFKSHI
jgi:hypothetical protein